MPATWLHTPKIAIATRKLEERIARDADNTRLAAERARETQRKQHDALAQKIVGSSVRPAPSEILTHPSGSWRSSLELNRRERIFEYPFGYSYPENCCESVSLILIYLIEEKYGASNVRLIKGTKPKKHELHLWVTVGDWVYDLTAHQFRNQKQIIGALYFATALPLQRLDDRKGAQFCRTREGRLKLPPQRL